MTKSRYTALSRIGSERLSKFFTMRQFLYSEISNGFELANIPDNPKVALAAGKQLATSCLDPLVETFGPIEVRSAYRSPSVNAFGNENNLNCANNEKNRAHHIWDQRDKEGNLGATACIYIPWFTERFNRGRDWRDLAYWLHDHLDYSEIVFFNTNCAFNLNWRENPVRKIRSWITGGKGGCPILINAGEASEDKATRRARYADFPVFPGIRFPEAGQ